jgi:6-phosphofructokinase 1
VVATAAESPGRGVVRLGGAGKRLAEALAANVEAEVRVIVLGHLQRGGSPSALDRLLATRLGARAIDLVAADRWNRVVVVHGNALTDVPLAQAAGVRTVDPNGELVLLARGLDVCLGTA